MLVKIALSYYVLCLLSGYKSTYLSVDSQYLSNKKSLKLKVTIGVTMASNYGKTNKKKLGVRSCFLPFKNTFQQNPNKNDARCGYNLPTVKLSQAINGFQQQQTGRLL